MSSVRRGTIVVAIAAGLALTGCAGGSDEEPTSSEPTTSEESSAPETSESAEGEESAAPEESEAAPAGEAPEGWPADVPLPEGTLITQTNQSGVVGAAWTVADQAAIDGYITALEGAGFAAIPGIPETEGVTGGAYQNATHDVVVAGATDATQSIISITVSPRVG